MGGCGALHSHPEVRLPCLEAQPSWRVTHRTLESPHGETRHLYACHSVDPFPSGDHVALAVQAASVGGAASDADWAGWNLARWHWTWLLALDLSRVTHFNLSRTRLDDVTADALLRALSTPAHSVASLDLSGNDIHDAGIAALRVASFPTLTALRVDGNRLTHVGLDALLRRVLVGVCVDSVCVRMVFHLHSFDLCVCAPVGVLTGACLGADTLVLHFLDCIVRDDLVTGGGAPRQYPPVFPRRGSSRARVGPSTPSAPSSVRARARE